MHSLILYKRLLNYVKPYWVMVLIMLISTAIFTSTNAVYAAKLKDIIDQGFIAKDLGAIRATIVVFLVVTVVRGIAYFISNYTSRRVSSDVVLNLRRDMFSQLQRLPATYFDRVTTGQTLSRFNYDVQQVTEAATSGVIILVREGVLVLVLLGYLFYKNWQLTLMIFALAPFIAVVIHLIAKRLRKLAKRIQGNMGVMNHILDENIKGHKIVKLFEAGAHESGKFNRATKQIRNASIKSEVASSSSTPVIELVIVCLASWIIWLMASDAKAGLITLGDFVSYTVMMLMLPSPIKKLLKINEKIQRGLAASQAIFTFLDEITEQACQTSATHQRCRGELVFEQVDFAYQGTDERVLQQFNLHIAAGETVAIVGASGSGKSSLAALIPRFYDVSGGQILLDGKNIATLDLAELRAQIAFVNQDIVLFDDSVARNIAYGATQIDMVRVKQAAQLAQAEPFILSMEKGYDSPIGEAGQRLSGGQKQRLAIARAIYKDAPILILDEATSALDSESELRVQQALDTLLQGRTAIVIAHRLSTVQNADRIVVLDKGRVIESGTQAELMVKKGRFYALNNSA